MPTCCVVSCRSKRKLHRFPRDPEIRNQWILATRQPAGWAPRADDRICSYHFLPSAITPTGRVRNPSIPVIAGKSFLDFKVEVLDPDSLESEMGIRIRGHINENACEKLFSQWAALWIGITLIP
jgi:hypothetical protein